MIILSLPLTGVVGFRFVVKLIFELTSFSTLELLKAISETREVILVTSSKYYFEILDE